MRGKVKGDQKNLPRERESNTKGVITGTRKFPILKSVIVIVTSMVKEIHCLCFPLWSVYSLFRGEFLRSLILCPYNIYIYIYICMYVCMYECVCVGACAPT